MPGPDAPVLGALPAAPRPGHLLICLVGRHQGERIVSIAKSVGGRGGTIALGQWLADSKILQWLSLADVAQDVVYMVLGDEGPDVVAALRGAAHADPGRLSGLAVRVAAPAVYARGRRAGNDDDAPGGDNASRSETMAPGTKLINVIVNAGYAEGVMAVARQAGARGGTIMTARGTGTVEDVSFFGITLVPEKEILLILADDGQIGPIVDAIRTVPALNEPGGGILYALDVAEVIPLGRAEKPADA